MSQNKHHTKKWLQIQEFASNKYTMSISLLLALCSSLWRNAEW